jgi:hypothetical protein
MLLCVLLQLLLLLLLLLLATAYCQLAADLPS